MAATETTPHALEQALDRLQADLGLSDAEVATVLGVTPHLLARWRTGDAIPEGASRQRLAQLRALHRHLCDTFDSPAALPGYLRSELRYLGGMTGLDALLAGRIDRVEAALEALDSGAFV